ncbi:MAG: hypothetical protein ABI718_05055 [Acidobacteriota bacterium]
MRRVPTLLVAIGVATALAIVSTTCFFYFRDNFSTHFPAKAISADILRGGALPYWNFMAGGGQPLAGNPNTLTFYPDTLLYLVLPSHVAFNLHFLLHLLAGWMAMSALIGLYGLSQLARHTGAALYVLSGAAISCLAFYNLVAAIALLPLILLTAERFLRCPSAVTGLQLGACCGLLGLAGEPVMVVSGGILILAVSAGRIRAHMTGWISLAVIVAVLTVSPLLVSYSEVAGEVERGFQPYSANTVLAASVPPWRALEIITGPFSGLITDLGPSAYHVDRAAGEWPPLLPLMLLGAIVVPALALRTPGTTGSRIVALLFLFLALGRYNPLVRSAVEAWPAIRIVRYPEKFIIPFTVAAVVAVAGWLDARRRTGATDLTIIAAAVMLFAFASFRLFSAGWDIDGLRLATGTAIALIVLVLAWQYPRHPGVQPWILVATFLPLIYWVWRAAPIDLLHFYPAPRRLAATIEGRLWSPPQSAPLNVPFPHTRAEYRIAGRALAPLSGMPVGVRYAFDRSPEGMYSYLSRITQERFTSAGMDLKVRYLRLLGVGTVISREPMQAEGLQPMEEFSIDGNVFHRSRVVRPLPEVMIIPAVFPVRSIQEAVARIESPGFRPDQEMVVPKRRETVPSSPMTLISATRSNTSIIVRIRAREPGSLFINESYFNSWVAAAGGKRLSTFPVNIDRLGVIVPAGETTVVLTFGAHRRLMAFLEIVSATLLLLALATTRSKKAIAEPAR